MKSLLFSLLIILSPIILQAQQIQSLFSGQTVKVGGWGGPAVGFTYMGDDAAVLTGGLGGVYLRMSNGNAFTFGGGGYGVTNFITVYNPDKDENEYLVFGYGGFLMGYVHQSNKLIHWNAQAIIGAGHVGTRPRNSSASSYSGGTEFFVFDPSIGIEMNVTDFFRVNLAAHYRIVSGSSHTSYTDAELGGPAGMLTFKFGRF